jgi:rhamnosyltransferase
MGAIKSMIVTAGIVTFNPDLRRLKENVSAIFSQVYKLIVYDNGSKNADQIVKLLNDFDNIIFIPSSENKGIAYGLNRLVEASKSLAASWILLLDQDSVCKTDIIDTYLQYINIEQVKLITCKIQDRNFDYENNSSNQEYDFVDSCITSGSFINIETCIQLGMFDEQMFIDKVDTDYSIRLKESGYKQLRVNKNEILHEVGSNTKIRHFLWKKVTIFNHSAFREYYIVRNAVYISRKYPYLKNAKKIKRAGLHRLILIFFFENEKINKIKAGLKGYRDGKKMQVTIYQNS